MNEDELKETNFQIAHHEDLIAGCENTIAKFESKLKTALPDEVDGIRSFLHNQKNMLDGFQRDLDKWKIAKADDVFPSHRLG